MCVKTRWAYVWNHICLYRGHFILKANYKVFGVEISHICGLNLPDHIPQLSESYAGHKIAVGYTLVLSLLSGKHADLDWMSVHVYCIRQE